MVGGRSITMRLEDVRGKDEKFSWPLLHSLFKADASPVEEHRRTTYATTSVGYEVRFNNFTHLTLLFHIYYWPTVISQCHTLADP